MPKETAGDKSEKRLASELGARQTRASGAMAGDKSDLTIDTSSVNFRAECKSTIRDSLSVRKEWLDKIALEARHTERFPILTISFTDSFGRAKDNGDWIAMRKEDWQEIVWRMCEAEDLLINRG